MDHFVYQSQQLHVEALPVSRIIEQVGTPCFLYSRATLEDHFDRLAAAFAPLAPLICYSVKSSANVSICRLLAERGAGMDLVSGGELHRALLAGVEPRRCVFAGAGKTEEELREALAAGVGWCNAESEAELESIDRIAAEMALPARVALRVNPDIDAGTHRYTTTGVRETKFGVDLDRARDVFARFGRGRHATLAGVHLHLGSPIESVEPYERAIARSLALIDQLAADGHAIELLNIGGGFAADYVSGRSPDAAAYAERVVPLLADRVASGLQVVLEPGRTIAANAGVLIVRVLYVKESGKRRFVICDGGMNVLLRPSHYEAFHFIWPCAVGAGHVPPRREARVELDGLARVDVVGPICETGDFLARDRWLPPVEPGDLLAVFSAGAYAMSMSSRYNSRPLPAEVLVSGTEAQLIRRRESYEDLTMHELDRSPIPVAGPSQAAGVAADSRLAR